MQELLAALCGAPGTPGAESEAAQVAADYLSHFCAVHRDPLGSVVGEREGPGPHILLDAHLDQIGMVVTGYEEGGFLRGAGCGSMDLRVLAAQEVTVHGARPIYGVIPARPPHLAKGEARAPDWSALLIDTGLADDDLREAAPLGTRITLRCAPAKLCGQRFTSPALDDRCGIAAILRCLELLQGEPCCRLTVLFSSQEECGGSGAKAAGFAHPADCAIAVDVSFARAKGISAADAQGKLGEGVMIGCSPALDFSMSEALRRLAKEQEIPHQIEVMGGRSYTNADQLQTAGSGIPCALLSIPQRNMHTAAEIIDLADIESTARLLAAYIKERSVSP